jgi:hypothetical protein
VAVTRNLSVILHAMWRDGWTFQFKAPPAQNGIGKQSISIAADGLFWPSGESVMKVAGV